MTSIKQTLVSIIMITAIAAIAFAQPPKKHFTPEIMLGLQRVSDMQLSPDGKRVMFCLGDPHFDNNKVVKDLYMISSEGSGIERLTNDKFSEYGALFSPKTNSIAYVSVANGAPQIFVLDLNIKKPIQVTTVPEGVDNIGWSPDGMYFSFTSKVRMRQTIQEKYHKYSKANVRIFDKIPMRAWDEWIDEYNSHLFIVSSSGGSEKDCIDLMKDQPYDTPLRPLGGVEQIAWAPDSKEICYTAKKVDKPAFSTNSDLYIVDIKSGKTKNITEGMLGYDKDPLYSPDGKWIAFHSQERPGFESDRVRLMLYNRNSGEIIELSKTLDQWVGNMVWSPDSKTIYFSAEAGPTVQLYQIDVPTGKWKILTKGRHNFDGGLAVNPENTKLFALKRDMQRPYEVYSIDIKSGKDTKITSFNDNIYQSIAPIEIEEREITSTDGKRFHCWVLFPPDFDASKKYPMITYCQGGPQSTISQYFSLRWNLYAMASHGYVVVAPNRRGVPGFGQEWNDAISRDWGGMPMQDILAATDAVSKEPYIKKDGLAAVGASAGGYAAFWLEGNHNKRFSAFVSHCGVFNMESMYGATEELFFPNWENGGPYWDEKVKSYYEKNSPHKFADKWDTPILISTGEKDFRVPYTQSLEAFTVAQSKGLPSKFIIFPEENHWILKLQEQELWYREFFDFLDAHCKK